MESRSQRYDLLADLLDYPTGGDYAASLRRCGDALRENYLEASELLEPLQRRVDSMSLEQIQEMYTRTFDINPVYSLEIGWHIYGEDYARGALLVEMRSQLREMNLPESQELPDHLTHVLTLLGRLDGEQADDLAARYLLPGLDKMLDGSSADEHPYAALLQAVRQVVHSDHDVELIAPRAQRGSPPDWKNRLPVFGQQGGRHG